MSKLKVPKNAVLLTINEKLISIKPNYDKSLNQISEIIEIDKLQDNNV